MESPRPVELIACESCGSKERDDAMRTRGQRLIEELRKRLSREPQPFARLGTAPCLWACTQSCAVHIRGAGRVGYVLCNLDTDAATADALIEFVRLYEQSADGAVPLRQRPQALKGHFLCRIPKPSDALTEPSDKAQHSEDTP